MQSRRKRQSPFEVARFWCEKKSDPPGFQVDMFKYKGRGIKSLINRSKGDFLLEYAGELISSDEGDLRETKGSSGFRFFFRDFCIDATEETGRYGRLVNHGEKKERNAVMKLVGSNTLCIFAARDIKENEEILYDYGIQSKCLPWKKLDSQAGQGYAVGMQKDLNIDTLEHDDEASEELHCKKSSSDLQEPENETSVPHCRDSCSVDHERYKEQAPVEPDNKTRYCSNPSGPYIEAPIETDNKASSSKDHEEPDSEIPVEPDSKASYCSNPSEPYIEAPIETDNKASSSKDHGESDSKIPVEPDNITRYCNNPSEPYIEAPIETDNKASSSIDHGESDSKIPVEPDNITRYCSNPSESYIEAPIETDNKASSSKDHGEPDSEIPVELDNKASYCSNPSEPYIEAPIETDNKASSSKDHGEPNSEIPVEPDNKASYCSNPSEPYNEAPIETDNKASSSKDHGESDSEIPVEPDNKTSYCSNPSEPYNEAPIETDNKASSSKDHGEPDSEIPVGPDNKTSYCSNPSEPYIEAPIETDNKTSSSKDHGEPDSEIPVGPDNINRYCSNPSEPYNEAPIETDNKASSCKVHGESDSEIPVGPDNKTSYCSNPSEPYNEAPIETDNKASPCKVHGEPDSEIPVGPDNKTSYCSNPSEPNIEAHIETDNKASSSKDHEEPDSEIPVEPDNKTSYCIRSDSVILVEPYNNTSFIHVGAAPIELHNSNCCTKDILTDNTRSRSRLKQVDSLKRKRHRENMVSKHRFEKKLKLKVPSSNLPRSLNDNLQGNGKKQVACVKPRTRSKTDNTSENMQERDDYLDDDQSDDDFDNDESSGSEYVPESCEDKDDDEDELSDEFPLQSKAQDKIHKENTDIDSRSQTDGGTYQSSITKAFFKNISLEAYCPNKGGKRNYSKTQYCLFCKSKLNSKISKHLFSVHYNEKRVSAIKKLPLRSMERKFALQKIQKEGNYEHNVQVLKKGSGTLIIYRRPSESSKCHPSEYIPCEYCFGFYHERNLWEHSKSCPERTVGVDTPSNYVRNGRLMLVPFINREECEKQELDLLIEKMKETVQHPGLKNICTNDKLIREFGMALVDKLGTPEEQRRKDHDNVRTKMRSVARLLKKLNENKLTNLPLSHFICAKEFMTVVSAVKCLSRDADSPNFAVTLGNYVKQITLLKASLGLQEDDNRSRQEAKDFQDLYTAHWNSKVSCVANRTKRLRALNQSIQLPSTEDLVKLKDYLLKEIENGIKIKKPTYEHFVWMTQVVTARIVLFNKRRIGEVDELKMQDFEKRTKGEEAGTNTEIVNSLNITERALLNRIELVEVRGKSTRGLRKVFILLTPDMVKGIDYLLSVRIYVGINPESVFVFGRTSDTPQDGCSAMRIVSEACPGLSNPTLIRTRLLRKYLATTSQVMDMTSEELKLVADHMGHSIAIHTDIYKLQSSILERTKVARALVALENGSLTKFKGKTLESIDIDELPVPALEELDEVDELPASVREEPDDDVDDELLLPVHEELSCENVNGTETKSKGIKRKRWSPDEERAFKEAFNCHIIGKKNASTEEIRKARLKYTDLQNRTESMIRVKLNNIVLGKCKVPKVKDALQQIENDLQSFKLYIKTDFKLHNFLANECPDHCITFALSDPLDATLQGRCNHSHDMVCHRCDLFPKSVVNIKRTISEIKDIPKELLADLLNDIEIAESNILSWKQHLIRCANQDRSRQYLLENLERDEVFIIMDFAMKFLPMQFREKQSEWYGQKGLNWHVCVCIFRDDESSLKHRTYAHIFDQVKQDWFTVVSILEHTLNTVKKQLPQIRSAYIRSDNAGCYHCGNTLLSLSGIATRTGIQIKRYDFSEAQDGKSYCDAKIAHLRSKIRQYVSSGNNVKTGLDMKNAIDSLGGVMGCQAAYVDINADVAEEATRTKTIWKGITKISNIELRGNHIATWKAFEVGCGNVFSPENIERMHHSPLSSTNLVIIADFTVPKKADGQITTQKQESQEEICENINALSELNLTQEPQTSSNVFSCIEPGCSRIFQTYLGLESHILIGKHNRILDKCSTYDKIKIKWKESCVDITKSFSLNREGNLTQGTSSTEMGWALKKDRKAKRFTENVKTYLRGIFHMGEQSGRKANPEDVSQNIRVCRDENGQKMFGPEEYLQPSQIGSFFSRLCVMSRNTIQQTVDDEDLGPALNMIDTIEAIDTLNS